MGGFSWRGVDASPPHPVLTTAAPRAPRRRVVSLAAPSTSPAARSHSRANASRASQVDRPRSSRRPTATQNKKSQRSIHDGDGRASSPGATKPSLECAGVCCLDAVPRDLCACALPTRPSPALWLLRLSSLKLSVGRLPWGGLELGSVGLALAAAPDASLSRRCAATAALGQAPPPTTPSLCCGTLLLSPSPAAPPRLLLLSCGERPASPLSARRPSLHPARASRAACASLCAAWA